MPPRSAAAKTGSSILNPISVSTWVSRARKTPAAAASPAPTIHVARTTRSVSMPVRRASSGESDIARIAFPVRV